MTIKEMDILDALETVWACRRCKCPNCDRGGAGELHDHVCTDGPLCVETRMRLLARRFAEAQTAMRASDEIKRLRRELADANGRLASVLDGIGGR